MLLPIVVGASAVAAAVFALRKREKDGPPPPPSVAQQVKSALEPAMAPALQDAVAQAVVQSVDPVQLVALANKLESAHPVAAAVVAARAQQILDVPKALVAPLVTPTVPSQGAPGDRVYTVLAGDNPTRIGQKLTGRSDAGLVRELAASNPDVASKIAAGQLQVGQRLKIPSSWLGTPVPSDTPIVTSKTYAVSPGDSPAKIASKLMGVATAAAGNLVAELAASNPLKSERIKAGQIHPYDPRTGAGDLLVIPAHWRVK